MESIDDILSLGVEFLVQLDPSIVDYIQDPVTKNQVINHRKEHYKIKADHCHDLHDITVGKTVKPFDKELAGIITDYHLSDRGKANGGIGVKFPDKSIDFYYPQQLKFIK